MRYPTDTYYVGAGLRNSKYYNVTLASNRNLQPPLQYYIEGGNRAYGDTTTNNILIYLVTGLVHRRLSCGVTARWNPQGPISTYLGSMITTLPPPEF